jgi:hypothetical protein
MQIIQSLRKRTRDGISVWHFCYDAEVDAHFAINSLNLKSIPATDRKHLRQIFDNFKRYGFKKELPAIKKQMVINDPWASTLPASMQMELEALHS